MGRPCTVCTDLRRREIEGALLVGQPNRRVAARFDVSEAAIRRHSGAHMAPVLRDARLDREGRQRASLLDQLRGLLDRIENILEAGSLSGDLRLALLAVREARSTIEVIGKFTGELVEQHDVHVSSVHTDPVMTIEIRGLLQKLMEEQPQRTIDIQKSPHVFEGRDAVPRLPASAENDPQSRRA